MPVNLVMALSLINSASTAAARVVLTLFALELGASPVTVGILVGTFSAFPLILSLPAGRIADRIGSRWPLMFGALIGWIGMLIPYFFRGLPAIFLAAAIIGSAASIYNVVLQNLVGLLSNQDSKARNFSNYSLTGSIGNFLGPAMGGFSIDLWGHGAACLLLAGLTLLPLPMLLRAGAMLGKGTTATAQADSGIRALLAEPKVRTLLFTTSLLNTGQELYRFYMPIYTHAIGLSASVIGLVLAANAAATFLVRVILPRLITRFGEQAVLSYAFYGSAAGLLLIPLFHGAIILGMISFLFGLGMGCGQPIITMLMFTGSAEGRSGEALGLRMTVIHLTKMVVPVVFGSIGSAFGLFAVFWSNALMLGTGGALSHTKKPTTPPE